MVNKQVDEMRRNFYENKKLCFDNPGIFMMCPRCQGTKIVHSNFAPVIETCKYCNGQGVITWIDRVVRGMKTPFTEERK